MTTPRDFSHMSPSPDWSGRDTAKNTRASAEAAARTEQTMADIAAAMSKQIELAESTRQDALRSEKFTKATSMVSLGVSVASLATAIAALLATF